jgi:hypothetical protein
MVQMRTSYGTRYMETLEELDRIANGRGNDEPRLVCVVFLTYVPKVMRATCSVRHTG